MSAPRPDVATDRPIVLANLSRRRFLQGATMLGGFVLAAGYRDAAQAAAPPKYGADGMPNGWVDDPLVFVAIAPDGTVSITCHRSEMGQGVRTGMPMIVADELEADWKRVRVVQAPGDEKRFGNQDTDGSRSTRHFFDPMRRCGAAARTMLEAAAAKRWSVPAGEVEARNHEVVHAKSGRRAGYGSLAKDAAAGPGAGCRAPQGPLQVPLYRQGPAQARGRAGHGERQSPVRHRHAGPRHALRGGGPTARLRGEGGERGLHRGAQGARGAQGGGDRREPGARPVQPAGRRGGGGPQYLGRHPGTPRPEGRLERRAQWQLRLGGLQGRDGGVHTVSVEHLEAGVDAQGKPVAWMHRSVAPTLFSTFVDGAKNEHALELGMGVINVPFAIPNIRIENPEAVAHTRIGWFRAVSNIPHAFAVQSFVAELAAAAGRDPKDYLLEVIGPARRITPEALSDAWNHGESPEKYPVDTGRLRRVVETAAREAGWGRSLPKGRGLGIAAHYSFVSYVATVVEVAVDGAGVISVPRIDVAVDCGATVNPDRVRAQMQGAAVMGLGIATLGEMTFKAGRAQQDNFHTYESRGCLGRRGRRACTSSRATTASRWVGSGARGAAHRAGPLQRDLRGHRQAHPAPAHPRPAQGLTGRKTRASRLRVTASGPSAARRARRLARPAR
jgi:hypothetical protein